MITEKLNGNWSNIYSVTGVGYICGHCGANPGPSLGYKCSYTIKNSPRTTGNIYICPTCNKPTFFKNNSVGSPIEQFPGIMYGNNIEFLPEEILELYNEARNCITVNAFTASVLSCRKLLMNVAVSKGAQEDKSFAYYVRYLNENHFIPPGSNEWVDHIRNKGNEATHEIPNMGREDAVELIDFTEMLLRVVYEMPGRMTKYQVTP